VKIIGPGHQSPRSLRRFEHEAEILARFQHPGLVPVFASGTLSTAEGPRPWFAMELVNGQPLHRLIREWQGSTEERIRLLLAICDAVQYAHHRGVVHRDLKPSNILVTGVSSNFEPEALAEFLISSPKNPSVQSASASGSISDSVGTRPSTAQPGGLLPQPRVVDFGVARLTEDSPQRSLMTQTGELFGTISYMSPEQFLGEPAAVDIQSDVYSLGVIGFEMLTGQLPHDRDRQTLMTVLRNIGSEVPRPLGTCDPGLRGDLEVIFAKALEADRRQRYASVSDFAADLQHFLNHETVKARPATAWYRCRKFVRRNRLLVGAATATTLALVTGILLYAGEARRARRAADEARYEAAKASAVNNFITNDFLMELMAAANAESGSGRLPVAELVDKASGQVSAIFSGRPLEEAAVRNELGTIHYNLAAWDRAADEFRRALELWEAGLGPDHNDTLKAVNNLGQTLLNTDAVAAEPLLRRALEGRRRTLGADDPLTLVTLNNLSLLLQATDRSAEAEPLLREAVESQTRVLGPDDRSTLTAVANLASLLARQGQVDEARAMHREVFDRASAVYGPDHVFTLNAGLRLAQSLHRTGATSAARDLLIPIVAALSTTLGNSHGDTITARRILARLHRALDNPTAASAELHQALIGAESATPPNPALIGKIREEIDRGE
jgi:serine/threonine protein kinase